MTTQEIRKRLLELYNDFILLYGPLNKPYNKRIILQDEMGFLILASLERKDGNGWVAADVLYRSNKEPVEVIKTDSPVDALSWVLGVYGKVDLDIIASIVNLSHEEILHELGNLVYLNPESGEYETADKYLSGNVYQKLLIAEAAYRDDSENYQLSRSLGAIEQVQPQKIPFELLELNLGSRWIPMSYYQRFAEWLFKCSVTIEYFKGTDVFKCVSSRSTPAYNEFRVYSKGRTTLYGDDLMDHAFCNTSPYITYGNPPVADNDAIQLANDKIETIRTKWSEWLYTLPEDDKFVLVEIYNNLYNCYVLRQYNGSHLKLPGLDLSKLGQNDTPIELYSSQMDCIWRIIQDRGAIIDHEVGAGKSNIMIIAAHEMKRMKIRNKPCIVCLKANVNDIATGYRKAYPNARILAPTEQDFEKKNRQRLFHNMKNNDWDAVIMTHDQFRRIPQDPEIEKEILQVEIGHLEDDLDTLQSRGTSISRVMRKGLEQRKATLDAKMKAIMYKIEKGKDKDINFNAIGIDHLMVDECFPYDTPVLTDKGWIAIGEIVEKKLTVNVLSYCKISRTFELMPTTNWLKKPLVKKLVKVTHEYGHFTCTEDHRIWTIECGYVRARDLTPEHTLIHTSMSGVWKSFESETKDILQSKLQRVNRDNGIQVEQTTPTQRHTTSCFTSMPKMWGENKEQVTEDEILQQSLFLCSKDRRESREEADRQYSDVSMVWKKSSSSQEKQILQCDMQNGTSESASPHQRAETSVWKRVSGIVSRRYEESEMLREDESQQSYAQSRNSSKSSKESTGENVSGKRGKWSVDRTTNTIVRSVGITRQKYGVRNSNQTCLGEVSIATQSLQSGHSHTEEDVMYRSGRKDTSNQEVEIFGQAQNRNIKCSGVVSVEIYQRAGDPGIGFSDSEDNFVYDLTVEKNHNYFAAGVLVSNCHRFKNLCFTTRHDRVAGLGNQQGSQKALNMLFAIRTLQKRFNSDLQATFLSGTPISNSLTEMYLLFKYLLPRELEKQNVSNFDAWAAVYTKKTTDYEFSVTNQIQAKERFRHFINVPELALLYNSIADYRTNKSINIDKPEMDEKLIDLEPSQDQKAFTQKLINFAKTGNGLYIGRPDLMDCEAVMLVACNYAKKMSTDMRLIDSELYEDHPYNKINTCCEKVKEFYVKFHENKGTQLIFCDLGVPDPHKWNVYDEIKKKLVEEYEIPAEEIAYIHSYNEKSRPKLFTMINNGTIRVLLASTDKGGVGVNIQQRVVAVHDIDIPWKPAELEQRGGRAARKGNWLAKLEQNNVVYRFIYAVKQSLDTYKFTLLKNKQLFIAQMKTNTLKVRTIDEGSMDEQGGMNFAEYVAILSGDMSLLEKAKIDKKLAMLESLRNAHYMEQHNNKYRLENHEKRLEEVNEILQYVERDNALYESVVTYDNAGTKDNSVVIYALQDSLNKLRVEKEAEELAAELYRQERRLMKDLKLEVPEKREGKKFKEETIIIGEYVVDLFKNWRPKPGEHFEVIGTVYGFNCCIERVNNNAAGVKVERGMAGELTNLVWSNQLYTQHPDSGWKYKFNEGVPSRENMKMAARNFVSSLDSIGRALKNYLREKEDLVRVIEELKGIEEKSFSREQELMDLKAESKRLIHAIDAKLKGVEIEPRPDALVEVRVLPDVTGKDENVDILDAEWEVESESEDEPEDVPWWQLESKSEIKY